MPKTKRGIWLLCAGGLARYLKPAETQKFINKANNVLGLRVRQ